MPVVSSLFIYPVKSCAGIALQQMRFDERGPLFDRRWMVVDSEGHALTLRECPRLARVQPSFLPNGRIVLTCEGLRPFQLRAPSKQRIPVNLWSFSGDALDMGANAAQWFQNVIERPCRLVQFAADVSRLTKRPADNPVQFAFGDRSPFSVATLESLSELNRRLEIPIPMLRFRPNIVLRDCAPFAEDTWQNLQTTDADGQSLRIELLSPTTRCRITTLNTHTLEYEDEPLASLARFRRGEKGVEFGQNALQRGSGTLSVGQELTVV